MTNIKGFESQPGTFNIKYISFGRNGSIFLVKPVTARVAGDLPRMSGALEFRRWNSPRAVNFHDDFECNPGSPQL